MNARNVPALKNYSNKNECWAIFYKFLGKHESSKQKQKSWRIVFIMTLFSLNWNEIFQKISRNLSRGRSQRLCLKLLLFQRFPSSSHVKITSLSHKIGHLRTSPTASGFSNNLTIFCMQVWLVKFTYFIILNLILIYKY